MSAIDEAVEALGIPDDSVAGQIEGVAFLIIREAGEWRSRVHARREKDEGWEWVLIYSALTTVRPDPKELLAMGAA